MAVIKVALLFFLITEFRAWPVGKDIDIYDYDLNGLDGFNNDEEYIDLSHLGPNAFGTPSNESGNTLASWSESSLVNPEEVGEYAEGDILMPPRVARNGVAEGSLKWPNGQIPYIIEGHFSQAQRDLIMKGIADFHRLTCLRFVAYEGQKDYIAIQSQNSGCWSSVGRIGGRQEVNLQSPGCLTKKGTVIHELLHAVGFMHEQSRPERDNFVRVMYQNIKPGTENNFKKADPKSTDGHGVPYDYNSVMHYSSFAFSKNSQRTIEPKVGGVNLGQREGLSRGDVRKVNNMYKCRKDDNKRKFASSCNTVALILSAQIANTMEPCQNNIHVTSSATKRCIIQPAIDANGTECSATVTSPQWLPGTLAIYEDTISFGFHSTVYYERHTGSRYKAFVTYGDLQCQGMDYLTLQIRWNGYGIIGKTNKGNVKNKWNRKGQRQPYQRQQGWFGDVFQNFFGSRRRFNDYYFF